MPVPPEHCRREDLAV